MMNLDIPGQNHPKSTSFWVSCFHGGISNSMFIHHLIISPSVQGCKLPSLVDYWNFLLGTFVPQWRRFAAVGMLSSGFGRYLDKFTT
jgi:hypothetical protein